MDSNDDMAPSSGLVLARARDRIIEYLQLLASRDAQLAYQASAPVDVSTELINQWDDWFPGDAELLVEPVFSADEREALAMFHSVLLEVVNAIPHDIPDLRTFQSMPAWRRLQQAATEAAGAFAKRER